MEEEEEDLKKVEEDVKDVEQDVKQVEKGMEEDVWISFIISNACFLFI